MIKVVKHGPAREALDIDIVQSAAESVRNQVDQAMALIAKCVFVVIARVADDLRDGRFYRLDLIRDLVPRRIVRREESPDAVSGYFPFRY